MAIDIGEEAKDRGSTTTSGSTRINKGNPANASGTITSIEIWSVDTLSGVIVGIFYTTNGNTLKCRDSATIGSVTGGSKQTFTEDSGSSPLAITVETGDYIGMYWTGGTIEKDAVGYGGYWVVAGEHIDPNDEAEYTFYAGDALSLYGTGTEVGGETYEESCSDGLKVGDTNKGSLVLNLSVTDGLKSGDAPASIGTFGAVASDGVTLSEALVTLLEANPAIADGIKISDLPSLFLTIPCAASDGVKLGEVLATLLQTYPSLSDGAKLGDATIAQLVLSLILSDGVKLGDLPTIAGIIYELSVTDGVKLSDENILEILRILKLLLKMLAYRSLLIECRAYRDVRVEARAYRNVELEYRG